MVDAYPRSMARTCNPARVKMRPRISLTVTTPSRSWTPPTRSFKWLTITLVIPSLPIPGIHPLREFPETWVTRVQASGRDPRGLHHRRSLEPHHVSYHTSTVPT